jgi:hypothetical protein
MDLTVDLQVEGDKIRLTTEAFGFVVLAYGATQEEAEADLVAKVQSLAKLQITTPRSYSLSVDIEE